MKRRAFSKGWTHAAVAAMAAYALVLQILLLSFGGALHAAAAAEPQTITCVQDHASGPDPAPAKAHEGLCCTLSCHGSAPAGPLPVPASLERAEPAALAAMPPGEGRAFRPASRVLPVGSRAPPRLG